MPSDQVAGPIGRHSCSGFYYGTDPLNSRLIIHYSLLITHYLSFICAGDGARATLCPPRRPRSSPPAAASPFPAFAAAATRPSTCTGHEKSALRPITTCLQPFDNFPQSFYNLSNLSTSFLQHSYNLFTTFHNFHSHYSAGVATLLYTR